MNGFKPKGVHGKAEYCSIEHKQMADPAAKEVSETAEPMAKERIYKIKSCGLCPFPYKLRTFWYCGAIAYFDCNEEDIVFPLRIAEKGAGEFSILPKVIPDWCPIRAARLSFDISG